MEKELKIRISGDISDLRNSLNSGTRDVRNFSSQAKSALENLDKELRVINGNAELFGRTLATDVSKVRAYQGAINYLLRNGVSPTSPKVLELADNMNRLTTEMNQAGKALTGTNGVAIEFSRIIQDAPFGIIGVGNNITQLTQSFANLQRQTGSTSQALKVAVSSMFTGTNLLVLGVSAITTALTVWSMRSRESAKATREADSAVRDYAASLALLSRVQYQASQSYGDTIARMNTLIAVARDETASVNQRRAALKELQDMYPAVFRNYDIETIKTQDATSAYQELTRSIIAAANARAAEDMISDLAARQLAIREENKERQKQINLLDQQIQRQERLTGNPGSATTATGEAILAGNIRRENDLVDERNRLQEENTKNLLDHANIQEQINSLANDAVRNQLNINGQLLDTTKNTYKAAAAAKDYVQAIRDVFNTDTDSANLVGLDGLDKINQQTRNKYQKMLDEVDKLEQQGLEKYKENQAERTRIMREASAERVEINSQIEQEISQNTEEYNRERNQKILDAVTANENRIRSIVRQGREQDLEEARIRYEGLFELAQGNADAITALTEQQRIEMAQINQRWDQREREEREKALQDQDALYRRYSRSLSSTLSSTFETILTDGENVFEHLGDAFKKMVVRMLAEAVALKAISFVFGGMAGGGAGGVLGFIGNLLTGGRSIGSGSSFSASALTQTPSISMPSVIGSSSQNNVFIPEVKISGNDLRLVFNRANTTNNIFNGGR